MTTVRRIFNDVNSSFSLTAHHLSNTIHHLRLNTYHPAFTIVELLVVIVVIGVLASITIVSYTGISAKAIEASITTDLDNALKKFKIHQVENGGYPTKIDCSSATSATNICLKPSANNQYTLTTDNSVASNQYFCISILNTTSNKRLYITNNGATGTGVCPTFNLTVIAGANGTVNTSANGSYYPGSTPTITATPNSGYILNNWTGSTGCNNITTASFAITMDSDKTCTANFVVDPWVNWYSGLASTVLAGKHIYKTDLGSTPDYETSYTAVASPQGAIGLDPGYPSSMSLVSPQANPSVNFSAYPAQNACKTVGGRLPNTQELLAIYAGRASYGNNFQTSFYWSSTEVAGSDSSYAYALNASNGTILSFLGKRNAFYLRCVAD